MQFAGTKETTAQLLADARDDAKTLLSPTDSKREPRAFRLSLARPLGTKRGRGERSFVQESRRQVVTFYGDLVENLKDWQAKAPRLPDEDSGGQPIAEDPRVGGSPPAAVPLDAPAEVPTADGPSSPGF